MTMHRITPVLLSGGSGTRLWPVSRALYPKQLLPMTAERTMFQETVTRFSASRTLPPRSSSAMTSTASSSPPKSRPSNPTPADCARAVRTQHRAGGSGRRASVVRIRDRNSDVSCALRSRDRRSTGFLAAIRIGAQAAATGSLVTFGIRPTRAETGYGYMSCGAALKDAPGAFAVGAFTEKPDRATAERFVAGRDYFWNGGMFLFSPAAYLEELSKFAPDVLTKAREALRKGKSDLDFLRLDKEAFAACPAISIDYAVMERTKKAVVVPADIGWSDVGSWSMLWERGAKDSSGQCRRGGRPYPRRPKQFHPQRGTAPGRRGG